MLEYLSESAERPIVSIGKEEVRYLSVGCLLLVTKFSSVEQLDQYLDAQKNSLLLGTYNSNNKFVHPAMQFILTENENNQTIIPSYKVSYLTYMVERMTSSTVKTTTLCPEQLGRKARLHNLWNAYDRFISDVTSCPNILANTELRASVMGVLPFVKPGRNPYGSDIDILRIIANRLSFSLDVISEASYNGIIEAVGKVK